MVVQGASKVMADDMEGPGVGFNSLGAQELLRVYVFPFLNFNIGIP